MKKFTVITALFGVGILAVWVIFQASAASPAKNHKAPIKAHDPYSDLLQVAQSGDKAGIPVTGAEARKVAPVYDATGAVVSDPSGTLWNAIPSGEMKIAPVYDATGELVADPTGTMFSGIESADVKVAPVYDATGAVVSDPSGTLWNVNPK